MKVNFTIDIPNWLYRYRWHNVSNYFKYHITPPRCIDCGVKLPFSYFDIWNDKTTNKPSVGVGYGKCVCPSCLVKRLDKIQEKKDFIGFQRKDNYNIKNTCDICKEKVVSFKSIRMSEGVIDQMRFCTHGSWNGHYVCIHCAKEAITNGEMRSSIYGSYYGMHVPLNNYGLPVINNQVKFPEK